MRAQDKIRKSCLLGFFAVILLGFLLHNAYFWTRPSQIFAIVAPVNESVWEHLKMAFWALMIYSLAEYPFLRGSVSNFLLAKALGSTVLLATIPVVFYSYTRITGTHLLWMDILSFVVGTGLCQAIAWDLYRARPRSRIVRLGSLFYLVLMALLFAFWTYTPPQLDIFKDHSSDRGNNHASLSNVKHSDS